MTPDAHRVQWTAQKIQRFWDHLAKNPAADELYFSRMVGESILRHARRSGARLHGRILDFGCGPGYLMERLLRRGIRCEGVDFSADSVAAAQQRLGSFEHFGGVRQISRLPTPLESKSYDGLFFIETIEHLRDDELQLTLGELHRLLSPGGYVIVTTPNDEDLDASEIMCPDCGAVFHRIQHLRSWNPQCLVSTMESHGFKTMSCHSVYFTQDIWASRLKAAAYRVLRYKLPQLLFVGQRAKQ